MFFLIELLRPFLRWLFWNKWRPWVLLVAVVVVVAVIVRVAAGGSGPPAGPPAGPAAGNPGPASTASAPAPGTVTPAAVSSPSSPPSSPAALPAAAGTVNIYSWLPFAKQDLAAAASVTERFGVDYDTFTYTETAAAYAGRMNGLITGQFAITLQADYSDPGVAKLRTGQRQVSTGTTVINSLRAFGPSSITFIITEYQRIVSAHGTSTGSAQYAVTVTGSGASWRVGDVELASAGNV